MHISHESFAGAMNLCFWALPVLVFLGAFWPIFFPPRKLRSRPYFLRLVFGVIGAQAAGYALLLGIVAPLETLYTSQFRGYVILDYPIDMIGPVPLLIGAVVLSILLFVIHDAIRRERGIRAAK